MAHAILPVFRIGKLRDVCEIELYCRAGRIDVRLGERGVLAASGMLPQIARVVCLQQRASNEAAGINTLLTGAVIGLPLPDAQQPRKVPPIRVLWHAAAAAFALVGALSWSVAQPSFAESAGDSIVRFPDDVVYKGTPGAPQHITLIGDSSKPGLYVDRIKFAAGTKVMPHWHPDSARTVLVMSGAFYFAVGETWNEAKLKALSPWDALFGTAQDPALRLGQGW